MPNKHTNHLPYIDASQLEGRWIEIDAEENFRIPNLTMLSKLEKNDVKKQFNSPHSNAC